MMVGQISNVKKARKSAQILFYWEALIKVDYGISAEIHCKQWTCKQTQSFLHC